MNAESFVQFALEKFPNLDRKELHGDMREALSQRERKLMGLASDAPKAVTDTKEADMHKAETTKTTTLADPFATVATGSATEIPDPTVFEWQQKVRLLEEEIRSLNLESIRQRSEAEVQRNEFDALRLRYTVLENLANERVAKDRKFREDQSGHGKKRKATVGRLR